MLIAYHRQSKGAPETAATAAHVPRYAPPCECGSCEQHFTLLELQDQSLYTYENIVTATEAESLLSKLITDINDDRIYLADRCNKFGNTILSRWRKKSRNKREALLLQADPSIERQAWFRFRTESNRIDWQDVRRLHRKSWLLPYMSTEIMKSNPSMLLGLIHNRIRHSPEEWAPFDGSMIRQGFVRGALGRDYCNHHCVVMYGVDYGKLVPWDKAAAERWDIIGYPRARLILEAQALMFARLRAVVDLILDKVSMPESIGSSKKWQEMMHAGSKQSQRVELWSEYINQPFSSPPALDVDYYCSVAKARVQAAEDHVWLLQTDPAYTRRFIKTTAVGEAYRPDCKHDLIAQDMRQSVDDCMRWRELSEAWSCLRGHYQNFRDDIVPGQPLPTSLVSSLALLEVALLVELDRKVKHLAALIPQRPGFQHLWKYELSLDNPQRAMGVFKRVGWECMDRLYHDDPLTWILMELQGHPDADHRFDHAELFARLEAHLAESNAKERERFDETIYAKMSEFAALHEMFLVLRLHRPAAPLRIRDNQGLRDLVEQNSTAFTRRLMCKDGPKRAYPFSWEDILTFDNITPASGRKTEAWLERRSVERKAMNDFWMLARQTYRTQLSATMLTQEEVESCISLIAASSTADYQEMVERERLEVSKNVEEAKFKQNAQCTTLLEDPADVWDTDPDVSKLVIEERAPKLKTRPSQPHDQSSTSRASIESATEKDEPEPQISTTRRALDMIGNMFPVTAEETTANIDWDVFVHAMADLDFAARNVGGSAVAFEQAQRKIIFHRPHPVAKIDSVMLQSMAKRLSKHFGWNRDMFIEA